MADPDLDATIAKLRAETERLEWENKKLAAQNHRDLLELVRRQSSPARKSVTLSDLFPSILAGLMVVGVIGALILVVIGARREHRRWEAFAKEHECRIVERRKGDVDTTVAPIVGNNSSVSFATGLTFEDDKTAYLCNDGVKYWR
jgi:hypothetical protein